MNSADLKKKLHDQIDALDEKEMDAIYSILLDYLGNSKNVELTDEHKTLIDQRLEEYKQNPKNVISWETSKETLNKYL